MRGFRDKTASPSQPFRAIKRSRLLTRLHYGLHPNRRLRILIKILTLRLCSYINLFSCQISSYGLSSKPAPPERLWADHGFRYYPCGLLFKGCAAKLLRPRDVLALYGARHRSPFHLATLTQLKMALNNCCSPDLLNVRRQPVSGWRPTSSRCFVGYLLDNPLLDPDAKRWWS